MYLGVDAAVWQSQVGAVLVTDGAHDDVVGLADFFAGRRQTNDQSIQVGQEL